MSSDLETAAYFVLSYLKGSELEYAYPVIRWIKSIFDITMDTDPYWRNVKSPMIRRRRSTSLFVEPPYMPWLRIDDPFRPNLADVPGVNRIRPPRLSIGDSFAPNLAVGPGMNRIKERLPIEVKI